MNIGLDNSENYVFDQGDPRQKRKQLWNVIIPQVCTEVINEMIILAIA